MIDSISLSQAGILCGILTLYVLLIRKSAFRSYSDYLLSAFIVFQCWTAFMYIILFSNSIFEFPGFFKTAAPINFLIPPLGYLYVRSILYNERGLSGRDLFHFLPFLIFLLSYLPFYLAPMEFKLEVIQELLIDKNKLLTRKLGWISESAFHVLRLTQDFIYLLLQWILILKYDKQNLEKSIETQVYHVLRWLKVFTGGNTVILLSFLAVVTLYLLQFNIFEQQVSLLPASVLGASFFVICTYLLIHPHVLIGLPFVRKVTTTLDAANQDVSKLSFSIANHEQELAYLESYFDSNKAYLQPNLSVSEVAVAIGIPTRELSYLINTYHRKRFNDYLNEMRIRHFLTQAEGSTLDRFTVEAIALESGFSSKSAFYRSFNRFYSCTPLEYLRSTKSIQ